MNRVRANTFANSSYRTMQLGLAPELRGLRDHEIEALVEEHFAGATAEEVENFAKALRSFGQAAGPLAQRALPGVVQGAATGAVAGPWGALIGGVVGGAAGLLATGNQQTPRPAPAPRTATAPPQQPPPQQPIARAPRPQPHPRAPTPRPTTGAVRVASPRPPQAAVTRQSGPDNQTVVAAARLLSLLARPEVQRTLVALLMGTAGRRTVRVGPTNVPVEMLAEELARASAELSVAAGGQSSPKMENY